MSEHQIRIQPRVAGQSKIVIDEEDISAALSGYTLADDARRGPVLTLRVGWGTKALIRGTAEVEIDPVTRRMLVLLGWQPPTEVEQVDVSTVEDLPGTRVLPGRHI